MLSDKLKFKVITKELKNIMFDSNTNKFKSHDLSLICKDSVIKSFNEFMYSYGYDESIGLYFVIVNKENEGFLFVRKAYKEENRITTHDFIVVTEYFKDVRGVIELFEINKIRENYYELLKCEQYKDINYSIDSVLSRLIFNIRSDSYKNPKKAKTLGLVITNIFLNSQNEYLKEFSDIELALINNYKQSLNNDFDSHRDINSIVAYIIINNIEYIVKNNVDINLIFNKIISDI